MPRTPTDYTNTIIYKVVCKDLAITETYVGHTTSFKDRKREHKSRCNCLYERPLYKTINENGGWDNWEMIEIEKYPCNDANEARARERYWYEELNSKLNARVPNRSKKECNDIRNNTEEHKLYMKEYNKNMTQEQKDKHYQQGLIWKSKEFICPCGSIILNGCKTKHFKTEKHIRLLQQKED